MKKKTYLFIGLFILSLPIVGYLSLSPVAKIFINQKLDEDARLEVRLSRLVLRPLRGFVRLELKTTNPNEPPMRLGVQVKLDPWQIKNKNLEFEFIRLTGIRAHIVEQEDGTKRVTGIAPIPGAAKEEIEEDAKALEGWSGFVRRLEINDSEVAYLTPGSTQAYALESFVFSREKEDQRPPLAFTLSPEGEFFLSLDGKALVKNLNARKTVDQAEGAQETADLFAQADIGLHISSFTLTTSSTSHRFSFKEVRLSTETKIKFEDRRFSPPFTEELQIVSGHFGALDTAFKKKASDYSLTALLSQSEDEKLTITGQVDPLDPRQWFSLNLSLDGVNLPRFSPYTERKIGYAIQSGILDLDTEGKIVEGKMDFKNKIFLHKIKLDRLGEEEKDQFTDQLGVPLNTFLIALRDKNGDIKISLPMEGDVSDPNVGLASLMGKVTLRAGRFALNKTLETAIPILKTINLGTAAAKFVFKVRFKDVQFEPGSPALTEETKTYLREMGETMEDKEKVRSKVCPVSTPADLKAKGLSDPEELDGLAAERAQNVRSFLFEEFEIDHKRLFECAPAYDDNEEASPRVELKT